MKILVLGARGFVGKNLVAQLYNIKDNKARWYLLSEPIEAIYEYDFDTDKGKLDEFCTDCSFVFNLAEVYNQRSDKSQQDVNTMISKELVGALRKHNNTSTIITGLVSNSCELSETEQSLLQYTKATGSQFLAYRFKEIFGKWCEPNTFSDVSTACYNVANDIPIQDAEPSNFRTLNFIDDVVDEMIEVLAGRYHKENGFGIVPVAYHYSLTEIVKTLFVLDAERTALRVPRVSDSFVKALYSTYLSYLPDSKVSYELDMKKDYRGSFTEFLRTNNHGQISVNVSKPSITKGQHWHNNRVEKFLVVSGHGLLQQRRIGTDENGNLYPISESYVSNEKMEVVEVRPGFTHNLINLSDTEDLVTIIWGNDCFDPYRPDTYSEKV